jgi:apolipoprotein D and lipocalin family protein
MRSLLAVLFAAALLTGCQSLQHPPLAQAAKVDLDRFMGEGFVITSIPTFLETDAYDAVESYRLAPDGKIETTFTFRAGGFDAETRRYTPRGFVLDRASKPSSPR